MNTENMLLVADLIENHPNQFDMCEPWRVEIHNCGTVGCIGGFADGLLAKGNRALEETGQLVFDLTAQQAEELFYGGRIWIKYANELNILASDRYADMSSIKPHHAVAMLRNLANGIWSFDNV